MRTPLQLGTLIAALLVLGEISSMASSVKLAWDPNQEPEVTGYRLYYGVTGGALTNSIDAGNVTTVSVPELQAGQTYNFHVKAYTTEGIESDPSNEVTYTVPVPNTPPNLEVTPTHSVLQGAVLTFSAFAADTDIPAQAIRFSLEGAVPAGATIDPLSGVFTWSTSSEHAPGSYMMTVVATDNGSPNLSATQTISIEVLKPASNSNTYYWLRFEGFANGFVSFTPKGTGKAGQKYIAGAMVTVTATPAEGATFEGWLVNGTSIATNPLILTMTENMLVTPLFAVQPTRLAAGESEAAGGLSMKIQRVGGQPVITVGGEVGAWALESSSDFVNWSEAAWGITSEHLTVSSNGHAFFRVRPNPELWNE